MRIAPARQTAFAVLRRVEGGGWASDLLLAATAALDSRDAGLASEIVFGVLRFQAQLDFLIEHFGGPRRLDAEVRLALRMGIYQLRYLERVPAHAAVAESVELVKRARKQSAAGMVNAVLRKVDRQPVPWPTREVELSCPEWLLDRWERHHGPDAARAIALAALEEPQKYVRVSAAGARFQDIGSQAIVPLLELKPGHTFLDLCAAPGSKTAQALEAGVRAVACDLHLHRLRALRALAADLVVLDGTRPLPLLRHFERILVDAPCSGTGTLGRNPEIKWRLRPDDLIDLHGRQTALLRNALAALAPGGRLVYSTCSLEPEENQEVVAEAAPGRAAAVWERLPGRDAGDGFWAAVIKSEEPAHD
ncbi:MAG: transcription antitermination factor NusB [Bryobacteraceae bacterium]|jgi:16S rRNA (cytosine967-C5)-methyltransferase